MSAEQIVDAIIADLEGRHGLAGCWWGIDPDIRAEIRQTWIDIANTPLGHAVPGLYEAYKAKNEAEGLRQIPTVEQVRRMEAERPDRQTILDALHSGREERRYASPEQFFDQKEEEALDREAERWAELGLDPNDWGDR